VIRFACVCGARLKAEEAEVGRRANCPRCGAVLRVPEAPVDDELPAVEDEAPAEDSTPTATLPPMPQGGGLQPLTRLGKAEIFRRTGGRCTRCGSRLSFGAAQYVRRPSDRAAEPVGGAGWEVLCTQCVGAAHSPLASHG
jgi:hypothetical protein